MPHHSPKNVKQKNRSSQFLSKFTCPWKASILPAPSFCCTQSVFLETRRTCCLFRTFSRPPAFFLCLSLSSFIECMLPAKKHNCVFHIITEPFYSHVQIGILLGVYMPSNLNYEKRWYELNISATLAGWSTFCAVEELFNKFSIPPCAAVDMTRFWQFLLCILTTSVYLLHALSLASAIPLRVGWGGADALLARIKDFSWQRIMRVLIVLQDIYHSPLLNCKGHRQTKTKQYPPNHGGEILNRSF